MKKHTNNFEGTKYKDDVLELIRTAGYKCESHSVETEDGYILKVHRIPPNNHMAKRSAVFLMHGLLAASADYVVTGPKLALAYYLADAGYDVFMGNARGNKHSMKHKTFSSNSKAFWTFSWHEIGYYDLPAMLDCVLRVTKTSKLLYVGHSQGTTSLLVLLSRRPEYNKKIIQAHLMAVSAYRNALPDSLDRILEFQSLVSESSRLILYFIDAISFQFSSNSSGFYDFAKLFHMGDTFSKIMCTGEDQMKLDFCLDLIFRVVGKNKQGVEMDTVRRNKSDVESFDIIKLNLQRILPTLLEHFSPRISSMQMEHYIQLAKSNKFEQFDYGKADNLRHYNSSTPPGYDIRKVTAPIYLYHAEEDLLVPRSVMT